MRENIELIKIKRICLRKGQNLAEVALIIGVLGLVLIGMQVYIKRGIQGKVKVLTDKIIGEEQSAYQQATLGLEQDRSDSKLLYSSVGLINTSKGGARSLVEQEATNYMYTYTYATTTKGQ
jgi:hypothetical protein